MSDSETCIPCDSVVLTNVANSCFIHPTKATSYCFSSLSLSNQQIYHSISNINKPNSYAQASQHEGWIGSMK